MNIADIANMITLLSAYCDTSTNNAWDSVRQSLIATLRAEQLKRDLQPTTEEPSR